MTDKLCVWCKHPESEHGHAGASPLGKPTDRLCPVDGVTSQFYTPPLRQQTITDDRPDELRLLADAINEGPLVRSTAVRLCRLAADEMERLQAELKRSHLNMHEALCQVIDGWNESAEDGDRGRANDAICLTIYDDGSGSLGKRSWPSTVEVEDIYEFHDSDGLLKILHDLGVEC